MGERTSYAPGTFSWAELVTSDAGAAKAFYTSVFGWEYRDSPVPGGSVYSMALRDGKDVAALFESDQQGPPHWNSYVSVESADATAARAAELGATVVAEPFDVMDVGRMAVIVDPQGAALAVWEAGTHVGASLVNTTGAMTWNDLLTPDPEASARFYGDLFGWTTKEIEGDAGLPRDPQRRGRERRDDDGPDAANWMPYFGHEDVERLAEEIGGLGGQLVSGPMHLWRARSRSSAIPGRGLRRLDGRIRRRAPGSQGMPQKSPDPASKTRSSTKPCATRARARRRPRGSPTPTVSPRPRRAGSPAPTRTGPRTT